MSDQWFYAQSGQQKGPVSLDALRQLVVTGAIALIVYEWVGLGFLRRGWINVDLAWNLALIGTGLLLLLT